MKTSFRTVMAIALLGCLCPKGLLGKSPVDWVDPLIGPGVRHGDHSTQSEILSGQELLTCSLAHRDLIQGGTLELDLGPEPNKQNMK